MSSQPGSTTSPILLILGDFRWIRAHVSFFAVGAVLLVCANLLIGGSELWSLTAIGIWSMLLIVHLVTLTIARLSIELLTEDDEEVVLLPVKDAVIVDPTPDPTATWKTDDTQKKEKPAETTPDENGETVSWQVATNAAQIKKDEKPQKEETSS